MLNDPIIKYRLELLKRNKKINEEYTKFKKRDIKVSEIWKILSEKYFTSISNIKKIIYSLNRSKKSN